MTCTVRWQPPHFLSPPNALAWVWLAACCAGLWDPANFGLGAAVVAAAACVATFAGYWRFQVWPLLVPSVFLGAYLLSNALFSTTPPDVLLALGCMRLLGILGALLAVAAALWYPVQPVPAPPGPFKVACMNTYVAGPGGISFRLRVLWPTDAYTSAACAPRYVALVNSSSTPRSPHTHTPHAMRRYFYWGDKAGKGLSRFIQSPTTSTLFNALNASPTGAALRLDPTAPVARLPSGGKHPVLIWSHGLAGCPDVYTLVTSHMASLGYIVLVPEHGDGSAPYTQPSSSGPGKWFTELTPAQMKDFHFQYSVRYPQLLRRVNECTVLLQLVQACAGGSGGALALARQGEDPLLPRLRSMLTQHGDIQQVFAGGHSFGAATTMALASHEFALDPVLPSDIADPDASVGSKNPVKATAAIRARVARHATAAPRAPLRGVVSFDSWMFSMTPTVTVRGMAGAPFLLVATKDFSGIQRDEQFRNGLAEMQMMVGGDRQTAGRLFADVKPTDDWVEASVSTFGMQSAVDFYAQPLVPPVVKGSLANGAFPDGTRYTAGVHPATAGVYSTHYLHNNFIDYAVLANNVMRLEDGNVGSVPPRLGLGWGVDIMCAFFDDLAAKPPTRYQDRDPASLVPEQGATDLPPPSDPASTAVWQFIKAHQEAHAGQPGWDQATFQLWRPGNLVPAWKAVDPGWKPPGGGAGTRARSRGR